MTTMVLDQAPELLWGSFVLRSDTDPDVPWRCETLATTEFGNAVPIIEFIESSLIVDGGEAVVTGWERRTFTVEIRITAPDGQAMSQAQQALFALVHGDEKPPLLWTPPMLGAWTGAFDVLAVKFLRKWDVPGDWSHRERYLKQRVFQLEFTCKTWIRDPEPIEVPALPVPENPEDPPAHVPLEDFDPIPSGWEALTGNGSGAWSNVGLAPAAGYMEAYGEWQRGPTAGSLNLYRPAPFSAGALPYLAVRVLVRKRLLTPSGPTVPTTPDLTITAGDLDQVPPVAVIPRPDLGDGIYDAIFDAPSGPANTQFFLAHNTTAEVGPADGTRYRYFFRAEEVFATDRITTADSAGFQVARQITIEGSGPTGAAIILDSGTSPLVGSTALIYTGPSEVISLRPLDVDSATVVSDGTMMSGARNDLSEPTTSLVPVSRLAEAKYDLLARLDFVGLARVLWSARLVAHDGTDIPGSDVVRSGDILLTNATPDPLRIHTIATISMPVIEVDPLSSHKVEVKIWMPTGGSAVDVDERWLADTRGAVTIVHEPSAHQLSKIEIGSPQLGAPKYKITGTWIGYGSQNIARLARLGRHRFPPRLLHIFTATDLAKYAPCSLRYHRTHAHEPGPALPEPAA